MSRLLKVGVISDTHGMLRPAALSALRGADHIIHAGDIDSPGVLEALRRIAPVTAIRGNVDNDAWARDLPDTQILELNQVCVYVIHNVYDLDLDPLKGGFAAIVSGHSHRPLNEIRDGVLYFNPGSAGPRRFHLPIALGFLSIDGQTLTGEILTLED